MGIIEELVEIWLNKVCDTTFLSRYLVFKVVIILHMDYPFSLSHLLYSILQCFPLDTFSLFQSFSISFSSRVLFPFIFTNFSPFYSNIPYHISFHPIHITFLLWIFQGRFLSNIHSFLHSFLFLFSYFPSFPFIFFFKLFYQLLCIFQVFYSFPCITFCCEALLLYQIFVLLSYFSFIQYSFYFPLFLSFNDHWSWYLYLLPWHLIRIHPYSTNVNY